MKRFLHWRFIRCSCLGAFLLFLSTAQGDDEINWDKERQFWSFQPPKAPERPHVNNQRWARQELDYFVLARMEERKLSPALEADRRTLLRRAAYDLTGLPPEKSLAQAFLNSEEDYETLVDRLLASPAFGERLASMWLPLARYAEDQAHQVGSDTKFFYPNAYRYRKWVIDAFNGDLPYNQFVRLQLAADKFEGENSENLPALGFIGLGPKYYNRNRIEVQADEWEDRVDTVTRTFLGLTVACARCHDHKFEPITREDYYSMAGIFASTAMINRGQAEPIDNSEKPLKNKDIPAHVIHMVEDGKPQDLNVFIRGNVNRKGPLAPRGFIKILSTPDQKPIEEGSGRKELALAISDPKNPLTARVIVNRVWGVMMGSPIVESPSNFGHSGQTPSNQALLDFLATRFIAQGGSIKTLAREIALSATYRQSSVTSAKMLAMDPSNEFLARMNRRRLTIEQWRDTLLNHSGELVREGGKSLELDDPANLRRTVYARISRLQLNALLMAMDYPDANVHAEKRASTTTAMQKLFQMNSEFMITRAKALATRIENQIRSSPALRDEEALTLRDSEYIAELYKSLYNRIPERDELAIATEFLAKPSTSDLSRKEQYAQSILISNELLYVD